MDKDKDDDTRFEGQPTIDDKIVTLLSKYEDQILAELLSIWEHWSYKQPPDQDLIGIEEDIEWLSFYVDGMDINDRFTSRIRRLRMLANRAREAWEEQNRVDHDNKYGKKTNIHYGVMKFGRSGHENRDSGEEKV